MQRGRNISVNAGEDGLNPGYQMYKKIKPRGAKKKG